MRRILLSLLLLIGLSPPVLAEIVAADDRTQLGDAISPDGTERIQCYLPPELRLKNAPDKNGQVSLCVCTSVENLGRYQNVHDLDGLQRKVSIFEGGCSPNRLEELTKLFVSDVRFISYVGSDPQFLRTVLESGRMAAVSWHGEDVTCPGYINHFVNLVHLSDRWACIMDNEGVKPGHEFIWMRPGAFYLRWRGAARYGWAVALKAPPPPTSLVTKVRPDTGLVETDSIPNDNQSLRLTIIAADAHTRRLMQATFEDMPGYVVNIFAPDDWAVADVEHTGFKMIVQMPDGQVIHTQSIYTGYTCLRVTVWFRQNKTLLLVVSLFSLLLAGETTVYIWFQRTKHR